MYKRILSALLCLCMLVGPVPVWASSTLTINSAAEFAQFAKNCRTDTYSKELQVTLGSDIDLSEYKNTVVPYFGGSFDGGGHTIKGISIKTTGSLCGLFRSLDKGAVVKNLNLQGVIEPGGSAAFAGGIAGQNAGTVQNCSFNGTVHGSRYVGGIVGINTSGGVVENCTTGGTVYAFHFVGGIVGENYGVVRNCQNKARVNASA
ncbi:MAG: hypothetical protein IIX77_04085, partial [Oscillospiraceae bacterium]|nr:hypothetical protein [Oscillospiraceae bacterium]